jgi:mitochondrial distribution and morphology protein 10
MRTVILSPSLPALLDFTLPHGLNFSISKSPNGLFKTTYSMTALPTLNGSVGYIFTSCDLNVQGSANVPFKHLVERFRVYDRPTRPEVKEEVWLAGKRVDPRGYLFNNDTTVAVLIFNRLSFIRKTLHSSRSP